MKTIKIEVDELIYEFYKKVAQQAGVPVGEIMSNALFRMAGELSLNAFHKKEGQLPPL